jgi:hypothetical protein
MMAGLDTKSHGFTSIGASMTQPNLLRFISEYQIKTLNIAGSRASKEPEIAAFVKRVLEEAFYPRPKGVRICESLETTIATFCRFFSFFGTVPWPDCSSVLLSYANSL